MVVEDEGMAVSSTRRTTDRVLSSIREGNTELMTKLNEALEAQKKRDKRRIEAEEEKFPPNHNSAT
jgi:hypothetical protein